MPGAYSSSGQNRDEFYVYRAGTITGSIAAEGDYDTIDFSPFFTPAGPLGTGEGQLAGPGDPPDNVWHITGTNSGWVGTVAGVYNNGDTQVYDRLISGSRLLIGELEPGQAYEFDVPYTLPVDHCGAFLNQAWAIGYPPGLPVVRDYDTWTVSVLCPPEPVALLLEPDIVTNTLPAARSLR